MNKIPVILDGDPGHDDAIAWVFAKASPLLDIKAVVSVSGNLRASWDRCSDCQGGCPADDRGSVYCR